MSERPEDAIYIPNDGHGVLSEKDAPKIESEWAEVLGAPNILEERIGLGADEDLRTLFGKEPGESLEGINELRAKVLEAGYFREAELDDTNSVISVVDYGETIYPAFHFNAYTKVPRHIARYTNNLFMKD